MATSEYADALRNRNRLSEDIYYLERILAEKKAELETAKAKAEELSQLSENKSSGCF